MAEQRAPQKAASLPGRLPPLIMIVDLPVQIAGSVNQVDWNTQLGDLVETLPWGHDLPAFRATTGLLGASG